MNTLSYRIKVSSEKLVNNKATEKFLTIPTVITLIGLLCILIYILQFSFNIFVTFIPLTVFLAVLSDLADGPLARKLNQQTHAGKLIDSLRDRTILIAGVANLLIIKEEIVYFIIFFLVIFFEIFSLLKRDYVDYIKKRLNPENQFIRICYAVSFCAVFLMTTKIYWEIDFLPTVWIFLSIITLTSLFGLIESIYSK